MGYFKDTVKGVSWMGALRVLTRIIAFAKIAILARLLNPAQFGIYGIAALVLAFLEIITETGINVFFIQEEGDIKKFINTAWIVSIARGVLISLVIVLFSPLISGFFKSPDSYKLILAISVVPLIKGFINPAVVKFQKELQFNKEFVLRVTVFSIDAVVAVVVAVLTKSAVSLVWGLIVGAITEVILSFVFIKPRPVFSFQSDYAKKVIERGKWVTAYSGLNYLFENGDGIAIGRLMNTASLGLYQMAYKISSLPISEVAEIFIKVTFPVYRKIAGDFERLKKAFSKTMLTICLLVIPFGLIFFLFPKEVVLTILGDKWLAAVPVIRVLAVFGIIRALLKSGFALFLAVKKQEYVTFVTLAGVFGLGITIIPLVQKYGILGAAYSALTGAIVSVPVFLFYLNKVYKTFRQ